MTDLLSFFFFFNDTATTEIYTLSLHDALPISQARHYPRDPRSVARFPSPGDDRHQGDRKSTRLNSSHANISYAVFCLKKKKKSVRIRSRRGAAVYKNLSQRLPHARVRLHGREA